MLQTARPPIQPSVEFFDTKTVGRETFRWLFFPGDVIADRRKKEIGGWLAWGGEETNSACLQKFFRGFIPRGIPALLETGADLMPEEQLRNLGGEIWSGMKLNDELVKNRLSYVPIYPFDARNSIIAKANNEDAGRKGIVELTPLVGKSWLECHTLDGSGLLDVIEGAFYGDGVEPTLRGLEDQIRYGKANVPIDLGALKAEMLSACDDFRGWGLAKLGLEHANLAQGTHPAGHVFRYSPLGELLLVQLEVQRQDQPFAELAKLNKDIGETVKVAIEGRGGMSASDLDLLERRFEDRIEERLAAARKVDAERIAELEARLEAKESEKKEHWKTREKREREEAARNEE